MKLQHLRALVAIADEGSFSEAAYSLGTAQSTISSAVAELEEELDVRLLERGRFGATPTEVGNRIIAHARAVERLLSSISQEALLEKGELRGTVRVSSIRSAAAQVLPAVIDVLKNRHPGLRVEVREVESHCSELTSSQVSGTVDVALTMSVLADGVIFWEILRDRYRALVPECFGHDNESISLSEALRNPVILSVDQCSWPVRERLMALDPDFRPGFEVTQDTTIVALVAQGLGVALMPELTIGALPPGARRVELTELIERRVGVALTPVGLKTPSVRAFLRVLRDLYPASEIPPLADPLRSAEFPAA